MRLLIQAKDMIIAFIHEPPHIIKGHMERVRSIHAHLDKHERDPLLAQSRARTLQDLEVKSLGVDLQEIDPRNPDVDAETLQGPDPDRLGLFT